MRFLVCNLVFGAVDSAAMLSRLAPDLHEMGGVIEPPRRRLLIKTHFRYSPSLPLAPHTAAAIYVLRDPADVMLSNFHYSQRSGTSAAETAADFVRYFDAFVAAGGDPRWLELGMGSWEENVRSWVGVSHDFPVLRIRYEDLLSDGINVATAVCRILGITRTDKDIAAATAGAAFDKMSEIEESDIKTQRVGIFYKPYLQKSIASGLRFMRNGTSGEAARTLTDAQKSRFDEVFGSVRREFGYRSGGNCT
jgi:aryl sulfotransferase